MVHINETLQCDFEKGHLLLLGCFPDHFASIICMVLTSRSAFSANKTSISQSYFAEYQSVFTKAGPTT